MAKAQHQIRQAQKAAERLVNRYPAVREWRLTKRLLTRNKLASAPNVDIAVQAQDRGIKGLLAAIRRHPRFKLIHDSFGNASYGLTLVAYLAPDMLWLRLCMMASGWASLGFNSLMPGGPVWVAIRWLILFQAVNLVMVMRLLYQRAEVTFGEDESDVYEKALQPHAITPRQANRIIAIGEFKEVKQGDVLCVAGQKSSSVMLLVRGAAVIRLHGRQLGQLEGGRFVTSPTLTSISTHDDQPDEEGPRAGEAEASQGQEQAAAEVPAGTQAIAEAAAAAASAPAPRDGEPATTAPPAGGPLDKAKRSVLGGALRVAGGQLRAPAQLRWSDPSLARDDDEDDDDDDDSNGDTQDDDASDDDDNDTDESDDDQTAMAGRSTAEKVCRTTVMVVSQQALVLELPIVELQQLVEKDPALRSAWTRLTAHELQHRSFLAHTQLRGMLYRERIRELLGTRWSLTAADRETLEQYRKRHNVSDEVHEEALAALGMRRSEYQFGLWGTLGRWLDGRGREIGRAVRAKPGRQQAERQR